MTGPATRAWWCLPATDPVAGPVGGVLGGVGSEPGQAGPGETIGAGVVDVAVSAAPLRERGLVKRTGGRCDTSFHGRVIVRKVSS